MPPWCGNAARINGRSRQRVAPSCWQRVDVQPEKRAATVVFDTEKHRDSGMSDQQTTFVQYIMGLLHHPSLGNMGMS